MLNKYFKKTDDELKEMREAWNEWKRLKTWNEKPRNTDAEIIEFYENMPAEYVVDLEMTAQDNAEEYLKDVYGKGLKVLDFGCGTGEFGLRLLKEGAHVDFYDLKTPAVEFLKFKLSENKLTANILHDMKDIGKDYDCIICCDVLEHLKNPYSVFMMLKDKLKKHGRLILDTPLIAPLVYNQDILIENLVDGEHIQDAVNDWKKNNGTGILKAEFVRQSRNHFIKSSLRVLMLYNYNRGTTGDFLERAFRKYAFVVSNRETGIRPNGEFIKSVCEKYNINLIFSVDSGGWFHIPSYIKIPKIAYSIDTFIFEEKVREALGGYDKKFFAQKRFAKDKNEYWLPLGVDKQTYKPISTEIIYDVAFCGTFLKRDSQHERNLCLQELVKVAMRGKEEGINLYIGRDYNEMASLRYNQSRIVFNAGICNDINMRLFEAAATGTPAMYNKAEGLEEMGLLPDEHYIAFDNSGDVVKKMFLALNNLDLLKKISAKARKEVLKKHTYDRRIEELIRLVNC